jgi:single stranded DNA-binding protein
MTTADLNQLLISGHVRREPELREEPDGDSVCSFVLTHTSEHQESGHWELQFYNVHIYGPLAESFAETCKTGQKIMITGRLDCELHETLTGYQPVVSIIATSVITLYGMAEHNSVAEQLNLV